jgi:prevent-host-death family protein
MAHWQLQEAKRRPGQVIIEAQRNGPQIITLDGVDQAVVLSIEDFQVLTPHKPDFRDYLLGGPKFDEFGIDRDRGMGRDISL